MDYGFIKSKIEPKDYSYKLLDHPDYYELKGALGPIRNIHNVPKSVSVALTDMINYRCRYSGIGSIDLDSIFYHHRSDQSVFGMSPKEAILLGCTDIIDFYKITEYSALRSVAEIKSAIANYGPVLAGITVKSLTEKFWLGTSNYGATAVLLTGYHPNGFTIRHCIGDQYGDKGYGRLPYTEYAVIQESWVLIK